jgi:small subunit ribosomal protein S4
MAKYTDAKCKVCRREGVQLMLKGQRCLTEKCGLKRKKNVPGQLAKRRGKLSEYGIQLREKQKIRKSYGVLEKQFHSIFVEAARIKGVTGENMLSLLERRLDNVVYRLGFSASRAQARQFIQHGHVSVNGNPVDIASYTLKVNDEIAIADDFKENAILGEAIKLSKAVSSKPEWLEVDFEKKNGKIIRLPIRQDVLQNFNEQLVVELYSK